LSEDGFTYERDTEILNLRNTSYIVMQRDDYTDWATEEGYIRTEVFNDLEEDGLYKSEDLDDSEIWQEDTFSTTLVRYPIIAFKVEYDGSIIVDLSDSGTFQTEEVQGSINFTTGELSITVSAGATADLILLYEYEDEDIPFDFSEFPKSYDYQITVNVID
jgi:hypothetical protein